MHEQPVISVESVSKAYRIWSTPAARLTGPIIGSLRHLFPADWAPHRVIARHAQTYFRDFWALQDVSFKLQRGESMGIVGRNGSGKSTLLQIIAGTLQPSHGRAHVRGRVAALLELGSGFNPEFTGRENVYLNATVLGLTRREIDDRYDDIVAFAEIGDFVDQPVKTYSSGMVVRLAFAVAAHVNPDILIIDEALSVGDARFQLKCARAIDRFLEAGVTLLFVSHDLSSVKRLCRHALLMEGGRLLYQGMPNDVANLYSKLIADGGSAAAIEADIRTLRGETLTSCKTAVPTSAGSESKQQDVGDGQADVPKSPELAPETAALRLRVKALEMLLHERLDGPVLAARAEKLLAEDRTSRPVSGQEFSYGGELGAIREIHLLDKDGQARTWFSSGEDVQVRLVVESFEKFSDPIFALTIKNAAGVEVYGTNTYFAHQPATPIGVGEIRTVVFSFAVNLMPAHYFISCGFTHFVGEELVVIHRRYDAIKLEVHGRDRTFGIANLHAQIRELPASTSPTSASVQ
jgi:ABC-type polysaccharide/polyol phosphate transport system ATPase subunit